MAAGGAGVIPGTPGFTWRSIDNALRLGRKRMPGGSSLVQLLANAGACAIAVHCPS